MILLVDNRDSFTFNLVHALWDAGAEVVVRRAHDLDDGTLHTVGAKAVVLGPGPGRPSADGPNAELVRASSGALPVVGVCFGHQALAVAWGGRLTRARELRHGKTTRIEHDETGLFRGVESPLVATVYHSLVVDEASLPKELVVTARDEHGDVMGLRHVSAEVEGIQFHPEALRTRGAQPLFRTIAGLAATSREGDG